LFRLISLVRTAMYKLLIVFVVVPFLTTTFGLIRADVDTSHIVTPTIIVPTETPAPIISVSDDCETVTLISKSVSIGTYVPTDLVSLTSLGYSNRYVRACVYDPLVTMMNDSQALGLHVTILSAYRSFATQTDIFNQYAQTYGVARANTFSAKPGHSEHQLGTVLDFGNKVRSGLSQNFGNEPEGIWLSQNAHLYGFTQSYPNHKTEITGYIYEPWHYRYVGISLATYLREHDVVIEEL